MWVRVFNHLNLSDSVVMLFLLTLNKHPLKGTYSFKKKEEEENCRMPYRIAVEEYVVSRYYYYYHYSATMMTMIIVEFA